MKLRNKKTGEIGLLSATDNAPIMFVDSREYKTYNSLAELNEEWEDVPEEYWYISSEGIVCSEVWEGSDPDLATRLIGNYFETKEEAKKAVEKLKAWKRLKDKGFKFVEHQIHGMTEDGEGDGCAYFEFDESLDKSDLDLLFRGEE